MYPDIQVDAELIISDPCNGCGDCGVMLHEALRWWWARAKWLPLPRRWSWVNAWSREAFKEDAESYTTLDRRRWLPMRKSADKNGFQSQLVWYKLCTTCTGKWQPIVAFRPRLLGVYPSWVWGTMCLVHMVWDVLCTDGFDKPEELPFKLSVVMSLLRFCISCKLK